MAAHYALMLMCAVTLPAALALSYGSEPCLQKPDAGLCKAAIPRWYYMPSTQMCKQFIWGGCGGTVPFVTEKQCKDRKCPMNRCLQKPARGPCRGSFPRWYYNKHTGACTQFTWGGCHGSVPFHTDASCRKARCNHACIQKPEVGPCKALIPRWYFDNNTGKCTEFYWGGCDGVVPFETKADCQIARCLPHPSPSPSPIPAKKRCKLLPDAGICTEKHLRWYWDQKAKKCTSFAYSGCFGTVPFTTLKECEQAECAGAKCDQKPSDVLPDTDGKFTCQAFWTSWYYNHHTKRCTSFSYSGCSNVGPFKTKLECIHAKCRSDM